MFDSTVQRPLNGGFASLPYIDNGIFSAWLLYQPFIDNPIHGYRLKREGGMGIKQGITRMAEILNGTTQIHIIEMIS